MRTRGALLLSLAVGCSGYTPPDRSGIMVNNHGLDGSVEVDAPGDGGAAALATDQVLLSFGKVLTDTRSAGLTATISNAGGTSVITSLAVTGSGSTGFVIDAETCLGATLIGAATCAAKLRFAPTTVGAADATLVVTGSAGGSVDVVLKGTGVPPGALAFTPAAGAFNDVTANTTADLSLQLQNVGTTSSGAITIDLSGPDVGLFFVTANNCAGGLAPSATCALTARFSPVTAGNRSATLSAVDALGGTMTVALTGNGI